MDWQNHRLLMTFIIISVLWVIRKLVQFTLQHSRKMSRERKRRVVVNLNFTTTIVLLIALFFIWSNQIQTLAISFIAFSMAIVLATKELIMCLTGTFYQSIAHPFNIGDHVIVGDKRGQVIDRGLFSTKILEIGPGDKTHQFTGRVITLPNSVLLLHEVRNESYFNQFVLHTFMIPLPYYVDTIQVEKILHQIAEKFVKEYYPTAKSYLNKLQEKSSLETPTIEATVNIKVHSHEEIQFIVRVTIPIAEKGRIEQGIIKEFLGREREWHASHPLSPTHA